MADHTTLRLAGDDGYDVLVGEGVLSRLPDLLGEGVSRVALVHPATLRTRAAEVTGLIEGAGPRVHALEVPDGEAAKTSEVLADCWAALGRHGFTRSDAVVSLGGGATTDLAGFVAASWLRGVRVVHVPTTLLGMVDAAVGGKTGVNTAEGKNLVGAFHHPAGVICDLSTLATLPAEELVSGMAEVLKCGFIADPAILDLVEPAPSEALRVGSPQLRELVERAVQVKLDVVAGDFKEAGGSGAHPGREVLNYGHTLAHAIERAEGYRFRHGEAVAIGMVFVAELARLAGRLDEETAARHASMLSSVGLPTTYAGATWQELLATMRIDKKTRGATLRFLVLDGLARPAVMEGPDEALLERAFGAVTPP